MNEKILFDELRQRYRAMKAQLDDRSIWQDNVQAKFRAVYFKEFDKLPNSYFYHIEKLLEEIDEIRTAKRELENL